MDRKSFLTGMGVGATLMFLLEPTAARRRAIVRDKTVSVSRKFGRLTARASRDLANRSKGLVSEIRARVSDNAPTGQVLAARVRSRLGRAVSDPGGILVLVNDGRVTLRGPVLASEVDDLVRAVSGVRGVNEVVNELEVHQSAANVPALQGRRRRVGMSNWPPAARLL